MNLEKTPDPLGRKAEDIFLRTLEEIRKPTDDPKTRIAQIQRALNVAAEQTATLEEMGRKK